MKFALLGALGALADDGTEVALGKRKERALLSLLLLHPDHVVPTHQILTALWPDESTPRPEASLHSTVARLRRTLVPDRPRGVPPTRLVHTPPGYRIVIHDDELDTTTFVTQLDLARRTRDAGDLPAARALLRDALALWHGPALAEFADEPWAAPDATRLESLRLAAYDECIGIELALGRTDAVAELEHLLRVHPLHEHLWSHLIVALYRAGHAPDALRRAQELRASLRDLGLEPSPHISELESAILRHDPWLETAAATLPSQPHTPTPPAAQPSAEVAAPGSTAAATASAPRSDSDLRTTVSRPRWWTPEPAFVGRGAQLARLRTLWEDVAEGGVAVAVMKGEPGIGKTWLAIETSERLAAAGALILAGRCSVEAALPYAPFAEALTRLVDALPDDELDALGAHRARLAGLLPHRADRLGGSVPASSDASSDIDRFLLFEAVTELLASVTRRDPVVLLVDDLQWADPSSLHLAEHVLRADASARLLLLATVRDTELAHDSETRRHLDRLARARMVEELSVPGFTHDEIATVIGSDGQQRSGLAGKVLHATGGNPFFVVELLRSLSPDGANGDPPQTPATAAALIRSRLGQLEPTPRDVLATAALLGTTVDATLLAEVLDLPAGEVADGLDTATDIGLLTHDSRGLVFRHDLVRSELADSLGTGTRAVRHRRIADRLVARVGNAQHTGEPLDEILRHYVLASSDGDPRAAVEFAHRAGEQATSQHAHATAASIYVSGLDALARSGGAHSSADELSLLAAASEAARRSGDIPLGRMFGGRALVLAMEIGTTAQLLDAIRAVSRTGEVHDREAIAVDAGLLTTASLRLAAAPDAGANAGAQAASALAGVALSRGDYDEMHRQLLVAVDLLDDDDPEPAAWVLDEAIVGLGEHLPIEGRLALAERLDRAAERSGSAELEMLAAATCRWLSFTAGDLAASARHAKRSADLTERLKMPRYLAGAAQRRAMELLLAGEFDAAEATSQTMLGYRDDAEFTEAHLAQIATIRLLQGRGGELAGALPDDLTTTPIVWQAAAAVIAFECGDAFLARARLRALTSRLDALDQDVSWLLTLALAARTAYSLGDELAAGQLLPFLTPHRTRMSLGGTGAVSLGPVAISLAEVQLTLGDHAAAEASLAEATAVLGDFPAGAAHARIALLRDAAQARRRPEAT